MQVPKSMNVLIRADASVQIGSGHVMRCLTLADELRTHGASVRFICRDWEGSLREHITAKGYECILLPRRSAAYSEETHQYAPWLGTSQEQDAAETLSVLGSEGVDWCICDHYAIDACWQRLIRHRARRIMVIDDIANRQHDCDLLLDQNLYDNAESRYTSCVPPECRLLLGPEYALLRPEFREARERLGSRLVRDGSVKRVMVFFGGSDPSNETAKAVQALKMLNRSDIEVDIIVGIANPHRVEIEQEIEQLRALQPNFHFHCQVPNMADFISKADLAIGAGGSTTWERCCLGLPTIAVIIAENQAEMTETAARHGLQWSLGWHNSTRAEDISISIQHCLDNPTLVREYSQRGQMLVNGNGTERVRKVLLEFSASRCISQK
jgi:UDP-2,4-diacetamido-2,4,6-trideoxy-beta-L-altropyranose hydrolase